MKKICQKTLSVLLSVMLVITGVIPAMAATPDLTLEISEKCYAGTTVNVTATITGLTAEQSSEAENFTWSLSGNDSATVISSKNDFKSTPLDDGTYTLTEGAQISFSTVESIGKDIVVSASFGSIANKSIIVTPLQPITSFSVSQSDDKKHAFYEPNSSTLYIDQYHSNNQDEIDNNFAILNVSYTPVVNDDELRYAVEMPGGSTKYINCETNGNDYKISVDSNAQTESTLTFKTLSGYSAEKVVNIHKCVPLTSFVYKSNDTTYENEATDMIGAIQGEPIVLDVAKALPANSNDSIAYTLYDSNDTAVDSTKYRVEPNADGRGCTITVNEPGTFTLIGKAVSYNNSNLERTLSRKILINVSKSNPIKAINFNNSDYEIYTYGDHKTLELATELNVTPGMNENTDTVEYVSDNTAVATVDKVKGTVTAVSSGTANITATAVKGQVSATCKITVIQAIETIELSSTSGTNILPLGHKTQIKCTISPNTAQEKINWSSSNPDIVSVDQNGNIEALNYNGTDAGSNNVQITATADSGATGSIPITVVPAIRAEAINISVEKVGNAALQTVDASTNTYSIYYGDTVSLICKAVTSSGEISNDAIVWRATIGNKENFRLVPLDEASNYFSYEKTGDNLKITSKTNFDITLTAFSILSGQAIDYRTAVQTVTIESNTKTTRIDFNPTSTTKTLPSGETYQFSVSLYQMSDYNKDKIVLVSSNNAVASVDFDRTTGIATVTTNEYGEATITCYACYDDENPVATAVKTKTLSITVTHNLQAAVISGITDVTYKGSAYTVNDFEDFNVKYGNTKLTLNTDYKISYGADNTNVGTGSIKVYSTSGIYQGEQTVTFKINPKQINNENVEVTVSDVTYSASESKPKVTVKDIARNVVLTAGKDYNYEYYKNINAGEANVVITGIGNYSGSYTKYFTVNPLNISSYDVKLTPIGSVTYDGINTPIPTITYKGTELVNGNDFYVTYSNNANPGKATATIHGIGNFCGTRTVDYSIIADMNDVNVTGISDVTYRGSAYSAGDFPELKVTLDGVLLTKEENYTVEMKNNIAAGTATVIIKARGTYFKNSKEVTFNIEPKHINESNVKAVVGNVTYNSTVQTPNVTVTDIARNKVLKDTDYTLAYSNNVNAGTGYVTITGKGNYTDSYQISFTINTLDVTSSDVKIAAIDTMTANGNYLTPTPVVSYKGATLKNGVDYTLSYQNNIYPGTATVAVNGIGNFSSSKSINFKIIANATDLVVTGLNTVEYRGSAYTANDFADFKVSFAGRLLTKDVDYSLTYTNNTNAGTATITINGKGNVTGSTIAAFYIVPKTINASTVTVEISPATFNGNLLNPNVTVTDFARSKKLVKDTDYTLSYSNNINAGTGYVTITGIGNYTGTYTLAYAINPLSITSSGVKVSAIDKMTATGAALTPVPTITYNGSVLTNGVDYILTYSNNVNAGTATITINGIGNFSGSRKVSFTITSPSSSNTQIKTATTTQNTGTSINSGTSSTAPSGAKKVNGEYINSKQKKASISKLTKGSKSFKATWKKISGITGYQIQYSTSSKFTKKTTKSVTVKSYKTTKSTVKKLKSKKKYYVRIRTYKNVKFNGKTVKVYSSWSKAKSVTTK